MPTMNSMSQEASMGRIHHDAAASALHSAPRLTVQRFQQQNGTAAAADEG
jgi:hypothetical protein